jgi:hypothetical protein
MSKIISPFALLERILKPLCVLHFGSCVKDKRRYLGEKELEKYLQAHGEAFMGIGRA